MGDIMKIYINIPATPRGRSFITDRIKNRLCTVGTAVFNETDKPLSGDAIKAAAKGCDVIITGWGQPRIYPRDIPDVKLIVHTGGTIGGITDISVFDSGITVISGNDYYAESVAEGVVAYMLYALRRLGRFERDMRNGIWKWDNYNEGLLDQSVGIISLGAISKKLIPMLRVFTEDIRVYSTHPDPATAYDMGFRYASIDEIFETCKIVSVHTASNAETYHMIKKDHFDLLQAGALFINTSRGAVIDEEALIEALKDNRFSALLDVYDKEPLPDDSPLRSFENVYLPPHMAGPTFDRREKITDALIDDIERFKNGITPRNIVTKEAAEKMTVVK